MMRILKLFSVLILTLITLFFTSTARAATPPVNILDPACGNKNDPQYYSSVCNDVRKQGDVNPVAGPKGIIQTAANLIAVIGGIAAVIIILISGIMYATAGGAAAGQRAGDNPTKAKNARLVLTNAVIGLVVIALAWGIVSFVVQKVIS